MRFKINNHIWKIKEEDGDTLLEIYQQIVPNAYYCFGLSVFNEQIIYLNKDVHIDKKRKTLLHELMHVYIYEYCSQNIDFGNEEIICDISANSHDIIHNIMTSFFDGDN